MRSNARAYSLGLLLAATLCSCSPDRVRGPADTFRVMSFNIRYDEPRDLDNAWPKRREMVAGTIRFYGADIAGLQEALVGQVEALEGLLPEYSWVGVGRDDGAEGGEFSPVFYLRDRFRRLDSGTFWLSEKPGSPGPPGWDGACPRIVTWARLEDLRTGNPVVVFNTHFDHVGKTAREESARLLRSKIGSIAGRTVAVLTGDFNCKERDPPFAILTATDGPGPALLDTRRLVRTPPYGSTSSYHGFSTDAAPGLPIDHIFVRGGFEVLRWGIVADRWDGRFVSDHNPVLAEIRLAPR
jgi:endonuclease/exonuclease/phosphatase family metal-dependent hydrolase